MELEADQSTDSKKSCRIAVIVAWQKEAGRTCINDHVGKHEPGVDDFSDLEREEKEWERLLEDDATHHVEKLCKRAFWCGRSHSLSRVTC